MFPVAAACLILIFWIIAVTGCGMVEISEEYSDALFTTENYSISTHTTQHSKDDADRINTSDATISLSMQSTAMSVSDISAVISDVTYNSFDEEAKEDGEAALEKTERFTYPMEISPGMEIFKYEPLTSEIIRKITGVSWKENDYIQLDDLSLCTLSYIGFDEKTYVGQMIVAQDLAGEVVEIFQELYKAAFPIAQIRLIDDYDGDDVRSMAANNTSSFCYRTIAGTNTLSNHGMGRAIDINPLQNPYVHDGMVEPDDEYLDRSQIRPGMITPDTVCYQIFASHGWEWGGDWKSPIDYQHFQKPEAGSE